MITNREIESAATALATTDGRTWASLGPDERCAYGDRVRATLPERAPETLAEYLARQDVRPVCGEALPVSGPVDPSVIICDYGTLPATRVDGDTPTASPLCDQHAWEHYGAEWRSETRKLGVRATARILAYRGETLPLSE